MKALVIPDVHLKPETFDLAVVHRFDDVLFSHAGLYLDTFSTTSRGDNIGNCCLYIIDTQSRDYRVAK